jgi:hypothetical protein
MILVTASMGTERMAVETSTPAALRGMVERDIERYGKLVRDVGMKAE